MTYLWVAVYRSIMGTVQTLQEATDCLKAGDEDICVHLDTRDELGQVGPAFNAVAHQLIDDGRNYRGIFDGSLDGIFRTDPGGHYVEANSALAKIDKYESGDAFTSHMTDATSLYVDPESRAKFREKIEREGIVKDFESEVRDEGPGLSAEDQKKLFRPFARLSATAAAHEHSVGLGLSIVKLMVQGMRGSVRCESAP